MKKDDWLGILIVSLGLVSGIFYLDHTAQQKTIADDKKAYITLQEQMDTSQLSSFSYYHCVTAGLQYASPTIAVTYINSCPTPNITGNNPFIGL